VKARRSPTVAAFADRGIPARDVFDHRVITLAKQYDDLLADFQARGFSTEVLGTGSFRQLNLYATNLGKFPDELFTNPTVNWHRQQFGLKGLVATAGLYLPGDGSAFVDKVQSDLCQQLHRDPDLRRRCKTQVDNRFGAWYKLIWNAVLDFAVEHRIETLWWPTASGILARVRANIDPALFERLYDGVSTRFQCVRTPLHQIDWWRLSVAQNRDRIVPLVEETEIPRPARHVICVFHDIEENVDTPVSAEACQRALVQMLQIERNAGVRATYNILGTLFREKAELVASYGSHAFGFHSFNHRIGDLAQLKRCREINLKVRGYRPPRSIITPELTDYRLSYHNFEWLLNAAGTMASPDPRLENGIVKIPVHLDDYPLASGALTFPEWRAAALRLADERSFVAIGLHDCYAGCWLGAYAELLEQLAQRGALWTCDDVSAQVFLHGDGSPYPAIRRPATQVSREIWRHFLEASRPGFGQTVDREHSPTDEPR
jgi:hypothetical protein